MKEQVRRANELDDCSHDRPYVFPEASRKNQRSASSGSSRVTAWARLARWRRRLDNVRPVGCNTTVRCPRGTARRSRGGGTRPRMEVVPEDAAEGVRRREPGDDDEERRRHPIGHDFTDPAPPCGAPPVQTVPGPRAAASPRPDDLDGDAESGYQEHDPEVPVRLQIPRARRRRGATVERRRRVRGSARLGAQDVIDEDLHRPGSSTSRPTPRPVIASTTTTSRRWVRGTGAAGIAATWRPAARSGDVSTSAGRGHGHNGATTSAGRRASRTLASALPQSSSPSVR